MRKMRLFHLITGILLTMTLGMGFGTAAVSAADATTTTTTTTTALPVELKLTSDVPAYSDNSGVTFSYNVTLSYSGNDTTLVKLSVTNPTGWTDTMQYQNKEINTIPIGPLTYNNPDTLVISVTLSPNNGVSPEPGEYKMTIKATSANGLSASLDLTAIVKDRYAITMTTPDYKLNTKAVAGKANQFTFLINNIGSATVQDITFSTSAPSGWTITYSPNKIDSLGAGQVQQVDATLTPPAGQTVAGDYSISMTASNAEVSGNIDIRVTVETPSIWGVVSIVIIVVVVIGLAILFWKLGRR
jgi:uncharacterized membrane protein